MLLLRLSSYTFQCIIDHLTLFHRNICLKYRELELNELFVSASYRTKAQVEIQLSQLITAHRQMGVCQHHVCDDSTVLAKHRLNDQDDFHSAIDYDIE